MLRRSILLTTLLLIPNCFPRGFAQEGSRNSSPIEADEYAAYSAFINQKYIPIYSTPMYTLQGKLVEDGKLDENGIVVIAAHTRQEFANVVGVTRYLLQLFIGSETNRDAEETFDDLISKSGPPVQLSNAFDLDVRYELAGDQNKSLEKFPRSKGLLSFSRVGFDAARSKALFVMAQLDLNSGRHPHPTESTALVLLNKEGGKWKVSKIWGPERKSFVINLGRCVNTSHHIPLALGSEGFSVNGRNGDRCVIEHMREIEGGYTRTRCRVPVKLDKLTIFESGFNDKVYLFSMDLSKYCAKPVHGSFFLDRIKPDRF